MAEKAEYRKPKTAEGMTRLILDDGRYPLDAFEFLHEGLELAGRRVYGNKAEPAGAGGTSPVPSYARRRVIWPWSVGAPWR